MTNEQKLREALQRIRSLATPPDKPNMAATLDSIYDVAEEALSQPTSDEGTQQFESWLRTVCFQQPTPEAYDLALCAWNAREQELARIVDETERSSLCHCPPEDKCHGKHYAKKLRAALLGDNT